MLRKFPRQVCMVTRQARRAPGERAIDSVGVGAGQRRRIVAGCAQALAHLRIAEVGEAHVVELQIGAAGRRDVSDRHAIGRGGVGPELGEVGIVLARDRPAAAAQVQHRGRRDRQLRHRTRHGFQKREVVHHDGPGAAESAGDRRHRRHVLRLEHHAASPGRGRRPRAAAGNPDARSRAGTRRRSRRQAERLLPGHRATDAPILHLAQLRGRHGAGLGPSARLVQLARAQETADVLGTERWRHRCSSSLAAACTMHRDDDPVDRRPLSSRRQRRAGGGARAARRGVDARPGQAPLCARNGWPWIGHSGRRPRGAPHRRSLPRGRSAARRRRRHLSPGLHRADRHAARRRQHAGPAHAHGPDVHARHGFTPLAVSTDGVAEGEIVFAGYGITAPDLQYDDYAGLPGARSHRDRADRDPRADDPASPFAARRRITTRSERTRSSTRASTAPAPSCSSRIHASATTSPTCAASRRPRHPGRLPDPEHRRRAPGAVGRTSPSWPPPSIARWRRNRSRWPRCRRTPRSPSCASAPRPPT